MNKKELKEKNDFLNNLLEVKEEKIKELKKEIMEWKRKYYAIKGADF